MNLGPTREDFGICKIRLQRGQVEIALLNVRVVTFKDVSLTYPHTDQEALHEVSLQGEPGQVIALIGSTGSGKSSGLCNRERTRSRTVVSISNRYRISSYHPVADESGGCSGAP